VIRDAVARYASRFHRTLGPRAAVASPLGAWLLLALVGPSAEGADRAVLADVLGCDPGDAFAAAAQLLAHPHAEVVLGAAVWHDPDHETARLLALVGRLAPPADAGPIPSQAAADAWARERTGGLIERFPLKVERPPPPVLLLATALATKVTWRQPFEVVAADAAVLPAGDGFAGRALLRDPGAAAWQGFVDTAAGRVTAFVVSSQDRLLVASVAGGPAAEPAHLLDAAQQIAMGVAAGTPPPRVSLFDLPLGDGPAWRVSEQIVAADEGTERYETLLPAWQVRAEHELTARPDLGFPAAGAALIALLPRDGDYRAAARQSAIARYGRDGFEAAAVTTLGVRAVSFRVIEERPVRTARVEFTRPHAVVAVTGGSGAWAAMPVFAAWVDRGADA
jgi:hypothetical protein